MKESISIPQRKPRRFLPEVFTITNWEEVSVYFHKLLKRQISNRQELTDWLYDRGELESVLYEDYSWRYIKMTLDTTNKAHSQRFNFYIQQIQPEMIPLLHELDRKLIDSPFLEELDQDEFGVYLKRVENNIRLYTDENIPLFSELKLKANRYASITGNMTIEYKGKELTLPQASNFLKNIDRDVRKNIFESIQERRFEDREELDVLMDELIRTRQQVARNAGYENYRDYKHDELNRFDYSVEDVLEFHEAIRTEILPLEEEIHALRRDKLGLEKLRPWDLSVDPSLKPPLEPFEKEGELLKKVEALFYETHPYFGEKLHIMRKMEHLDLSSRKGKAPGGYNSTLSELGVPFIFMNASGSSRDVRTMIHEGGHAVHSFLMRDIPFMPNRNIPSEVAELASMSMELMTFDKWHLIYEDEKKLIRAKIEQLEGVLKVLPWVAVIDKFQQWIYTHPEHDHEARSKKWIAILDEFSSDQVDWSGYEQFREYTWQRQLHIYEVPFYYIEYAIAQLGAIAIWKNYQMDPEKTVRQYMDALKLGYTRSIKEVYEAAGIRFDFSKPYVQELARFVRKELKALS